jgi:uncharacterized protein YkwD
MKRPLLAAMLASVLLVGLPIAASAATIAAKCSALVTELNQQRNPDVRLRDYLCTIAHNRSLQQARAGRMFHNTAYVARKLDERGIRWCSLGEVVAYSSRNPSASLFIGMWRNSPTHWNLLTSTRYDSAGGSWRVSDVNGFTYATMILVDLC